MSKAKKIRRRYLQTFAAIVFVLALVRLLFPGVAGGSSTATAYNGEDSTVVTTTAASTEGVELLPQQKKYAPRFTDSEPPHPIRSVSNYDEAFPDSNHVQLQAAQQWGVPPVKDRADAELRKNELVYMGLSPYYDVAKLDASIPYLVPRAAILLHDIGSNFFDSLYVKGLPLHQMVVSSVLRSEEDVARLRRSNKNATEQSCHLYGTTVDINYNTYTPVDPQATVPSDKLKFVLSEVLRDLRQQGRCYIKYEKRQPCFHLTVR